ncbi:MAG: class I SAM-dependent methyltransferase [Burkholderiales bacterium]
MQHAMRILRSCPGAGIIAAAMLLKLLKSILPHSSPPAPAAPPPEDPARILLREHQRMSQLALPGPNYMETLAAVHALLKPRTYLEIGVEFGRTLALAAPLTRAIGVDPAPKVNVPLGSNARVFALTSDDFFAQTDVTHEFGGLPVELAFIDGMHHFEFALRDFIAIERLCSRDSTILMHDTFPIDRMTAERKRKSIFWSGDTWRALLALKKYRPDLAIYTISAPPTGITLIRRLDPTSRVLSERLGEIVAEFHALDFSVLESADKRATLNVVPNEPAHLGALLA